MTVERRRTHVVYEAIKALVDQGASQFRPGNVNSHIRSLGQHMGTWEVRREFTALEAEGVIKLDTATADWTLLKERLPAGAAKGRTKAKAKAKAKTSSKDNSKGKAKPKRKAG